ncbi:hypothetical protein I4P13_15595 [Elizabethkingia meningoseptica]|uniref:hypothetical protein n=1 Tax=Elizabethkingia meningoseptica TaxID=238 RepID=UPI0018C1D04D|nr:hypothetical protein [Elizabethkingia meningoseptica]MBG0512923.1 hypothetical protein [Elizabethkingia meningoseptica]MBG0515190.1 hypothetical protein [Elizabethkingia meningoseptica]
MKEELNTKMHSTFSVDKETQTKHAVWAAMRGNTTKEDIVSTLERWGYTEADYLKYKTSFPK